MPNTTVPAAAEGLPKNLPTENVMSRRAVLGALAVAPAAALPAIAEAQAAEHPSERCNRLAWELAEALDDYDRGKWLAEVHPAQSTAYAVCLVNIRAREEMYGRTPEERCRFHAERLAEAIRQSGPGHYDAHVAHLADLFTVVVRNA